MSDTDDLVWIKLHVEMGRAEAHDFAAIDRAEWEAMTVAQQEAWIDDVVQLHLSNNVSASGWVVDPNDVPDGYR